MNNNDMPEKIRPRWGDTLVYQHTNLWCRPCGNIFNYTYAGAKGKYPDYTYRFTRFGDASIADDGYQDIFIRSEDLEVGKSDSLGRITEYTTHQQALDALEVAREYLGHLSKRMPIHECYGDSGRINYKRMNEMTETADQALAQINQIIGGEDEQ